MKGVVIVGYYLLREKEEDLHSKSRRVSVSSCCAYIDGVLLFGETYG